MNIDTLIVFAPHPDDEILGCGGYIAKLRQQGARVYVIVVTDGARGVPIGIDAEVRQQECLTGLKYLGIDNVEFWGYPDTLVPLSGKILDDYRQIVEKIKPTIILLPNPQESHSDHQRVTRGIVKALENQWQGNLFFYETVHPATVINHIVDISSTFEKKFQAIQAHKSQLSSFDFATHVQTLARLRGLQLNTENAEAFLQHEWDGTAQNFFETRPLISVIVRADDPLYIRYALASLIQQTYEQFEVILVWFGNEKIPDIKEFNVLDINVIDGRASRSFNLNQGLLHANGEYIAILDQDDILYPNHFASLLAEIHGQAKVDVVYSGCKVVTCTKTDERIERNKVIEIINKPWQAGRLLIGNTIPVHTLLLRASIFHIHKFDEMFEIYEDWELLIRLHLSNFNFVHVDEITCEYRIFSDHDIQSYAQVHEDKAYLEHRSQVIEKLLKNLDLVHFEQIAAVIDNLEKQHATLNNQLLEQSKQNQLQTQKLEQSNELEQWLAESCAAIGIEAAGRQGLAQLIARTLPDKTLFSIILPVYNTDSSILTQTLFSIRNQAYQGWELCLVDDASDSEETQNLLQALQHDPVLAERLRYKRRETQGGIVAASNDALKMATAPYVAFVDHDDILHNEAFLTLALELQQQDYTLLYTDSRMIDHNGEVMHTYHKADWSPETLLSINYINHLTVVKREVLNNLGGLRDFNGAQDLDLLLQFVELPSEQICHVRKPLYDWRATEGSVAYQSSDKTWVFETAQSVLKNHLIERGLTEIDVIPNPKGSGFVCNWHFALEPIDIIIPTHNNINGLKTCLNGLLHNTDYPKLNIILVANRCSKDMDEYLNTLKSHPKIKILTNNDKFNWSALNNQAVAASDSSMLLFLNDDVEIKQSNWLHNLCKHLYLKDIGAVGATLFYANGEIQHNGIETNPKWIARNISEWGNENILRTTRNVSAVTGACLLTKRSVWQQVGGFDEKFAVSYNDVDFCLAIRSEKLRIIQANEVELIHHEHVTYGEFDSADKKELWHKESKLMQEKWRDQLIDCYMARYDVQVQRTRMLHVEE